jgi:hypothetical protein
LEIEWRWENVSAVSRDKLIAVVGELFVELMVDALGFRVAVLCGGAATDGGYALGDGVGDAVEDLGMLA